MENKAQKLGQDGEEFAKKYLLENNYDILETNWRFKKLEVDIIATHKKEIIFVEVKTRSGNAFGEPEDFVNKKKQQFLIAAAHDYLIKNNINLDCRFDIVSIMPVNSRLVVKHIPNAFYATVK
jgi:putative endonuclease